MDLKRAALFGSLVSKDYAEDLLRLLVSYQDISSSEAASRLNLHIRTVQDFLDALAELGVVKKEEVFEKKRPYFRYTLVTTRISFDLDLNELVSGKEDTGDRTELMIRERKDSGARFSLARDHSSISSIIVWQGEGRNARDRKISLTRSQGKFMYHLPFPTASFKSINGIMDEAEVESSYTSEILDLVSLLEDLKVVEVNQSSDQS